MKELFLDSNFRYLFFFFLFASAATLLSALMAYRTKRDFWKFVAIWGLLSTVVFFINAIFQYVSFSYYIYEEARSVNKIVFLRTLSTAMIWMSAFLFGLLFYRTKKQSRVFRLPLDIISVVFILAVILMFLDCFLLYYSGLHITPTAVAHMMGAETIVWNALLRVEFLISLLGVISLLVLYYFLQKKIRENVSVRPYIFLMVGVVCTIFLFSRFSIFYTLPERLVLRPFVQMLDSDDDVLIFPELLERKLEKFGIDYDLDNFYLVNREQVFTTSTVLLPEKFKQKKPNVIIIFLESFSSRLSSVYNSDFSGLTPGLDAMASHEDTTVFHNFHNASTPTATGLLSLLCSHYPTTSHLEIVTHGVLSGHRLLCLPEVLEKNGYGHTAYFTSVDKSYAHKDRMFSNMGTDKVVGTTEMKKYIDEKPLSWGFSDHQMMPVFYDLAEERSGDQDPFLFMLSTVDTHPPYSFPADGVTYDDGVDSVLDTFHSTDDAFVYFWNDFIAGPLASDTILLVVADHAAFPSQPIRQVFPEVEDINYYDENVFLAYVPSSTLPSKVSVRSNGVDFAPTVLHMLGINTSNSFEGYSVFDGREKYPNLLAMHDLGIYINETVATSSLNIQYSVPENLNCDSLNLGQIHPDKPLELCELDYFYKWKKQQFQKGRFWKK